MNFSEQGLQALGAQVGAEWQGSPRLRMGLLLIALILLASGWMAARDLAAVWREEAAGLREQARRLQPLNGGQDWPQRAEDAKRQLEAARALTWTAASQGRAEADVQDTLRDWSTRLGLKLREISVLPAADVLPGGVRSTRIHLVMDHDRPAVLALLAELARSPRILAVEGMKLRPQAPSSRTEIEVRVLIRVLGEGEER